jgi:hypothetical protein
LKHLQNGFRLPVKSSNEPVDGLAVKMANGNIRIVIFSFDEGYLQADYTSEVTISIKATKKLRITKYYLVDKNNGNAHTKWLELGKPPAKDLAARKKLIESSKYKIFEKFPIVKYHADVSTFTIPMPKYSVIYLELSNRK